MNLNSSMNQVSYHSHKILQKSIDEHVERKIKNEIEIHEEPLHTPDIDKMIKEEKETNEIQMHIQDVNMDVGEESIHYEKPVAETAKCYHEKHQRTHIRYKVYTCSHSDSSSHIRHLTTQPVENQYQSSQCDNDISNNNDFEIHTRTHTGEQPYQCSQCNKTFTFKTNLINHHQRIHNGKKPYQCSHCNKAFARKSDIIRHQRTHTGRNHINA
ncbi:unnamed protein product, partial [Meganyctiphanes norvegica]